MYNCPIALAGSSIKGKTIVFVDVKVKSSTMGSSFSSCSISSLNFHGNFTSFVDPSEIFARALIVKKTS